MDKQKELQKAKEWYEGVIKKIGLADKIIKKIKPALPDEWRIEFDFNAVYELQFIKGSSFEVDKKPPIEEFKLICKLLEKLTGRKVYITPYATKKDGLWMIEGCISYFIENKLELSMKVVAYNPGHSCEITYKRRWITDAKVSDDCLGLGGE